MRKFVSDNFLLLFAVALPAVLLKPSDAVAHLVTTGMGPVYDGVGHLLLTPEDLVPALSAALYAGLRGRRPGRRALFLLPLAWFLGGVIGLFAGGQQVISLPALSFLILGVLIAADLRLPTSWFTVLIVLVGLIHGFFNGLALKDGPGSLGLVGIMATLFVLVALVSAFVVSMKPPWTRIAVRVTGSWVATIGILMIGWFLRGQG
jgi:urease accessory protein